MKSRPSPIRLALASALALAALALITPATARAGLILTVQSVSVNANSTGDALDLTLTNSGPSAVAVGGFSFEITTAVAGLQFTSATIGTTTSPYIFAGHSLFGPTINTTSGSTLDASDIYSTIGSGTTLSAGATVGLGHILFDVGTAGGSVMLTSYPSTSLSGPTGNNIPITTLVNGSITTSSVPEPASLFGLLSALPVVAYALRRASSAKARRRAEAIATGS